MKISCRFCLWKYLLWFFLMKNKCFFSATEQFVFVVFTPCLQIKKQVRCTSVEATRRQRRSSSCVNVLFCHSTVSVYMWPASQRAAQKLMAQTQWELLKRAYPILVVVFLKSHWIVLSPRHSGSISAKKPMKSDSGTVCNTFVSGSSTRRCLVARIPWFKVWLGIR